MMRALLYISLFILSASCFGQQIVQPGQMSIFSPETFGKAVPTRIFPDVIENDTCSNRAVVYELGMDGGFVTGTNENGDIAKIQRLIFPGEDRYEVTEVGVAFAVADDTLADFVVSARIYNDLISDTIIGELLATSDSVRVGDILLPDSVIRFTTFTFPNPPIVERDSFWVYIDLSNIGEAPPGGNVGIFSTIDGCGDGNNVIERATVNGVYVPLNRRWQTSDTSFLNVEMFVYAIVDPDLSVSTSQPVTDYRLAVSPNPTADHLTVKFDPESPGRYRGSITDMQGRTLRSTPYQLFSSTAQFTWSLADLPAGLYLYHVDGPRGRQSGKVVKR